MITAAIIGVTLINIMLFAPNFSSQLASTFYILAIVIEIYPLCYYAQLLIYDCECLAQQVFQSHWIGRDVKYQKMIVFFMQRVQQSMELSAGKIFPINLNSFVSVSAENANKRVSAIFLKAANIF